MGLDGGYKIDARVKKEGCPGVSYSLRVNRLQG